MNNSITVSSNGVNGKVGVTADTAQHWSQKSREWATSDVLVDNEDYSSKYYAKKSKEAADVATTAINDIEVSKTEFDNSYNEKSQALNTQYTNYSSELATQKTEVITDITNKTEGLTDLYNGYTQNLSTQETQAIQNIADKETESIANIETSAQTKIGKINTAGSTQITNIQNTTNEGKAEITTATQNGKNEMQNIYEQFQEQVNSGALIFNAPFYLGASQYIPYRLSDIDQANMSLLISEGQENPKKTYPSVYDWILKNVNNGVEGFKGKGYGYTEVSNSSYIIRIAAPVSMIGATVYGYNPCRKIGTIESVSNNTFTYFDNEAQRTITAERNAAHDIDIDNTYWITDYDFRINTENETFRLPLLNGEEDLISDKYDELELKASKSTYIAPANGWYSLEKISGAVDKYINFKNLSNGMKAELVSPFTTGKPGISIKVGRNAVVECEYTASGETIAFRFIYAKGNGYLYYYVGDTVKDADLINAGALAEGLALKQDKCIHIIDTYVNGTSGYRVWSDGYCEQWGRLYNSTSLAINIIKLTKKYADTNYQVLINHGVGGYYENKPNGQFIDEPYGFTVDSFKAFTHNFAGLEYLQWHTYGYLAEGEY